MGSKTGGGSVPALPWQKGSALARRWGDATGMEKLDAILSLESPRELVQSMRGDELLWLVKDIGPTDCLPLLAFATGEQWQTFVDVDCWRGDRFAAEVFEEWLTTSMAAGIEAASTLLHGVDKELLVLMLMSFATVHEKDVETGEIPDSKDILTSPDGEFVIEMPARHPSIPLVDRALRLLYAQDLEQARMVLRATRWEVASGTEEELLRWRAGRLEELGFPTLEDAQALLELVAPGDAKRQILEGLDRAGPANQAPSTVGRTVALTLPDLGEASLLLQALDAIADREASDSVVTSITFLVNALLVLERADFGDVEAQRAAGHQALAMLNLALDHVTGGDAPLAARVLERVWLRDLYRIGASLVEPIRRRAARLKARTTGEGGQSLLDAPMDEAIAALARRPPRMLAGVSREGEGRLRPVRTMEELRTMRAVVERAEAIVAFVELRFGFTPARFDATDLGISEDSRTHVRLSTLVLTAFANAAIGRGLSLEPFGQASLDLLVAGFTRPDAQGRSLGARLRLALAGATAVPDDAPQRERRRAAHLRAFLEECLESLEETLAIATPGAPLDPRFIGSVLLVRDEG